MPRYRTPAELAPRSVAQIPKKPPAPSLRTPAEARRGPRANATDEPTIIDQSTVRVPSGERQEPKYGQQSDNRDQPQASQNAPWLLKPHSTSVRKHAFAVFPAALGD
jgi:hypothetical protein